MMKSPAIRSNALSSCLDHLDAISTMRWWGRIIKANGQMVESEGPFCAVGECCQVLSGTGQAYEGEVVGFRGPTVLSMTLRKVEGVRYGDRITTWGARPGIRVGEGLIGRVIDGSGQPIDSGPPIHAERKWPLHCSPPKPLERVPVREPMGCGVRAIDGLITAGRGQRLGIFGGSGVGKSTLIGMMARGSSADIIVLALVGERGREVGEFLEKALGPEGMRRSVVVASTSDRPPLLRIRAALAASSVAEYFCSRGKNVLLVVDSLTRVAMAQREIGLAAGEPPTSRGYTPSVFTLLAGLIERAGRFASGSITGFYTVLMEGDDQQDPLVDAVRALLDGHIVLDRRLNMQSHFPPISVLDSLSRLMSSVCSAEHLEKARRLRKLLAAFAASEDLVRVGAYQKGLDPDLDRALEILPALNAYLQQKTGESVTFDQSVAALMALPA
ncbi:MAG TPA: FliI/YscN family ATPase [Terriglobia bacterium]|jgi:flagellum-specific ATP synthase|nr:FliI/YscN family ATPase [Terriglobia bacterium]